MSAREELEEELRAGYRLSIQLGMLGTISDLLRRAMVRVGSDRMWIAELEAENRRLRERIALTVAEGGGA